MHVLCVIPARLGSTRLPQKPLRLIAGEPLIAHVARRVVSFGLDARVVVATDDERVCQAVSKLGVETLLTSPALGSGTERALAVLGHPRYRRYELVVTVQGDEPLMGRAAVVGALERVTARGDEIGTAAAPLDPRSLGDPNRVKVLVDGRGRALAFYRHGRATGCRPRGAVFHHLGVYAYRAGALRRWAALPRTVEEEQERLEQLRPLGHGMAIGVAVLAAPAAPGVDAEADLEEVEKLMVAASRG